MTITENPHAAAILESLADLTMASQPLPSGDGVAPKSPDGRPVAPCTVLYLRPGGSLTGSLGQVDTEGEMRFQVTCVGRTAAEARVVADKVATRLTTDDLTVDDRWIARVRRVSPASQTQRDDDLTPPLFYVPVQFTMLTLSALTGS